MGAFPVVSDVTTLSKALHFPSLPWYHARSDTDQVYYGPCFRFRKVLSLCSWQRRYTKKKIFQNFVIHQSICSTCYCIRNSFEFCLQDLFTFIVLTTIVPHPIPNVRYAFVEWFGLSWVDCSSTSSCSFAFFPFFRRFKVESPRSSYIQVSG